MEGNRRKQKKEDEGLFGINTKNLQKKEEEYPWKTEHEETVGRRAQEKEEPVKERRKRNLKTHFK